MLRRTLLPLAAAAAMLAGPALAQPKTEITFARCFGACEGDYGTSQDVAKARGECGVMTTLVNLFNATNKDNILVKPQIIEWGPYYQQLNARIAARDRPRQRAGQAARARRLQGAACQRQQGLQGVFLSQADGGPDAH